MILQTKTTKNTIKNGHIFQIICIIILIIDGSGSGKTNVLLNLINKENDIDKTYLHARDLS